MGSGTGPTGGHRGALGEATPLHLHPLRVPPGHSREGKGHQRPADHDEIQNVPQVPEIGTLVKHQPQIHHLRGQRGGQGAPGALPALRTLPTLTLITISKVKTPVKT